MKGEGHIDFIRSTIHLFGDDLQSLSGLSDVINSNTDCEITWEQSNDTVGSRKRWSYASVGHYHGSDWDLYKLGRDFEYFMDTNGYLVTLLPEVDEEELDEEEYLNSGKYH